MDDAVATQVQRYAQARADLAAEFELLSVQQLGVHASSSAAGTTNRPKRIFSVEVEGEPRFPGFQFDAAGRPRPAIAEVLAALGGRLDGWELALWFTSDNGWLGAQRPVDVLVEHPDAVVDAARHLAAELAPDGA